MSEATRIAVAPNEVHKLPDCAWCGLRIARHTVHATPTCTECKDGGRAFRVKVSLARFKRGAEKPRETFESPYSIPLGATWNPPMPRSIK